MSKELIFSLVALRPILDHARAAPGQSITYAHRMDATVWKKGATPVNGVVSAEDVDAAKLTPALFLAKDHGVYLMSAGIPWQLAPDGGERSVVVYADGMHPDHDPDWYDTAHSAVGGDDFAETLPVAGIDAMLAQFPDATTLCINLTRTRLSVFVR